VPKRGGGREKGNEVGWGFEEWLVCDVVLVVCRFRVLSFAKNCKGERREGEAGR